MEFMATLRRDAEALAEKQIDLQSIHFRQGREIALAYVGMMKSYARLNVMSGHFTKDGERSVVQGFCRVESQHFDAPLTVSDMKQSFWTAQWTETVSAANRNDLFEAFCTSFSEFCGKEGIRVGELSALIRTKEGELMTKRLPVTVKVPSEQIEAIGFPYEITF